MPTKRTSAAATPQKKKNPTRSTSTRKAAPPAPAVPTVTLPALDDATATLALDLYRRGCPVNPTDPKSKRKVRAPRVALLARLLAGFTLDALAPTVRRDAARRIAALDVRGDACWLDATDRGQAVCENTVNAQVFGQGRPAGHSHLDRIAVALDAALDAELDTMPTDTAAARKARATMVKAHAAQRGSFAAWCEAVRTLFDASGAVSTRPAALLVVENREMLDGDDATTDTGPMVPTLCLYATAPGGFDPLDRGTVQQ
jgi:hypothetical protein